eukprot:gene17618-20071_t
MPLLAWPHQATLRVLVIEMMRLFSATRLYYPCIKPIDRVLSARSLSSFVKQKFAQNRVETFQLRESDGKSSDPLQKAQLPVQKMEHETSLKLKFRQSVNDMVVYLLPQGYPNSVRKGYSTFITGQIVSNTLSTAAGVLSMQSLLYAMGLGMGFGLGTAPLAATLNWVIKDGLGQLGGVIFASFVSNRFDADPKRWRLTATVAMDSASFIELLTPLAPSYFLLIASVANVAKNISFLAASASRAAIHKSFALQENLADVTAKTGSQSIVSSLIGTSLGVSLSTLVAANIATAPGQYEATVGLYCVLSSVSIAVTYWSLKHVTITSLSQQRLDYVLYHYFSTPMGNDETWAGKKLISPEQLRQSEALLGVPNYLSNSTSSSALIAWKSLVGLSTDLLPTLKVGCDLNKVVASQKEYDILDKLYQNEAFVVNAVTYQSSKSNSANSAEVFLLFKEHATLRDVLRGQVQAFLIRMQLHQQGYTSAESILPTYNQQKNQSSRIQNVGVLETTHGQLAGRDSDFNAVSTEVVEGLITKLLEDKDWKISNAMLETRFARLC